MGCTVYLRMVTGVAMQNKNPQRNTIHLPRQKKPLNRPESPQPSLTSSRQ